MNAQQGRGIINIVNFIRGIEPRPGRNIDLIEPVVQQMRLAKEHNLPVTWLVQYDALLDERFVELLRQIPPQDEIGIWLEFVQPLVEQAGLLWHGRYPWDWHVNVGFSVGYAPAERTAMVDIFIDRFKQTFGHTPKAAGSWFTDAHTLAHLAGKHGIEAFCNCKDQWGTDGYTLWGGYFNQAYYPSRLNAFIPAQHVSEQIGVPVFRMLGSDPINQYEIALGTGSHQGQAVLTLEAISPAGGNPDWVDHFLEHTFRSPCLSFGYTQVGQENSFGWPAMQLGLTHQHRRVAELRDQGLVRIETLSESGRRFSKKYPLTPASAVVMDRDLDAPEKGALWYCSKNYRSSLIWDCGELRMRDLQLFDERRAEPFLNSVCPQSHCKYDALPLIDGLLWSTATQKAGGKLTGADALPLKIVGTPVVYEEGDSTLVVLVQISDGAQARFTFEERSWQLQLPAGSQAAFTVSWASGLQTAFDDVSGQSLNFCHEGYRYGVTLEAGKAVTSQDGYTLLPDAHGCIRVRMAGA